AADNVAVREQVARPVPGALEAIATDDLALRQRPAGMGAHRVEGENAIAVANDRNVIDSGLEPGRPTLRDVRQPTEIDRHPLCSGATPGVMVDVSADE